MLSECKEAKLDHLLILLQNIENFLPIFPVFRYRFKVGTFCDLPHVSCHLRQQSEMLQVNVSTEGHSDMQRTTDVFPQFLPATEQVIL